MNCPNVKDRGVVSSRHRETSLDLHRKNHVQRERLDKELKRLELEQQKVVKRSHLERCAVSRDRKDMTSEFRKLSVSEEVGRGAAAAGGSQGAGADAAAASARRRWQKITVAVKASNKDPSKRTSKSGMLPIVEQAVARVKRKQQEKFMDPKLIHQVSRLRKASRVDAGSSETVERKGKPRIPPNAWHHGDGEGSGASERSSAVFKRLSVGSSMNTMPSEQFLRNVRKQRSRTIPGSPKTSRKTSQTTQGDV